MIGIVSGTVTAAARSLGHLISLLITGTLMLFVGVMLYGAASSGTRSLAPSRLSRWGPFLLFSLAVPLILADLVRHLLQDHGVWAECGNNPSYSRINTTDPFPPSCLWSSSQYRRAARRRPRPAPPPPRHPPPPPPPPPPRPRRRCEHQCCVSVWQEVGRGAAPSYGWVPPSPDFFPDAQAVASGAPQFATLRPDGSLYFPPSFDRAVQPYRVFTPPLVLYADNTRNPLTGPPASASDCPHGLNNASGYCNLHANASAACSCDSCTPHEDIAHLSPVGWIFTIVCTYTGFLLLAAAVLWNANVHRKLADVRERWRALRAAA